ncbi:hypothetical protein BKA67DRAFT_371673 [Truncatella angustata]|uniref:Uncharacterized protein n=1 Tax=Truncatella angustata TaxID=152316 RepID=A0A9P8UF02_9PEZI|nr:uncharacterized protein BKA67DRAFT_371673 [Truncatella angustata]KAH6648752.1 hypothetical protein BKA67DRAFT_371673 [Truncatella angustata]
MSKEASNLKDNSLYFLFSVFKYGLIISSSLFTPITLEALIEPNNVYRTFYCIHVQIPASR